MRGAMELTAEMVLVRAFGGEAAIRWLVSVGDRVAYVTNAAGAEAVKAGARPLHCVGVPLTDVYVVSEGVRDGEYPDWESLTRRFGPVTAQSG